MNFEFKSNKESVKYFQLLYKCLLTTLLRIKKISANISMAFK